MPNRSVVPSALAVLTMLLGFAIVTAGPRVVTVGDARWLGRVTFGVTSDTLAHFRELGRDRYLREQLQAPVDDPQPLATRLRSLRISQHSALEFVSEERDRQRGIRLIASDDERRTARAARRREQAEIVFETMERHLVRAVQSPWQLREQLTWFWMNHFSVFARKATVAWMLPEYEETLRGHALGRFQDLVMASVTSPAMLVYLDNARSVAGRLNENYARELMELHTLGVSGGPSGSTYTQTDVQELARVLTGAGVARRPDRIRSTGRDQPSGSVRRGLFVFSAALHDNGSKTVLGTRFKGGEGFEEIERAVEMLCRQPATARFISSKLAQYFIADSPPPRLVARMADVFRRTNGSIAEVLRAMFTDDDVRRDLDRLAPHEGKFKDPVQFVVSSLRLSFDGGAPPSYRPAVNWLRQLGQPLYGRVTPDGYPLTESAWASPGQLTQRIDVAQAIARLAASSADGVLAPRGGAVFAEVIAPGLGPDTRRVLDRAASSQEWSALLLAAPEWSMR